MLRPRSLTRSRTAVMALVVGTGAVAGLSIAGLGSAQDETSPAALSFAGPPSFADVVQQVSPAVVMVSVTADAQAYVTGGPFAGAPFDEFFERFGMPDQRRMVPQPRQGVGSGFIIDASGYVATNYHVVDGARAVSVTLDSGEVLPATVVGTDPRTDLALLRIDNGGDLPTLDFGDSDSARVGDWVLAIGNPFGLGGTATAGIISARGRDIRSGPYDDFLQIDAAINSGNSGGPVFNAAGEVIGINTAIFSPTGGNVGIGFAIPANQARRVLEDLRDDGAVSRGWLGVEIGPVAADGLEVSDGAAITAVVPDGPAAAAGLLPGDVIVRLDGAPIDSYRTLSRLVGSLDAGDEVELEVRRGGETIGLTAELGLFDEARVQAAAQPETRRYRVPGEGNRYEQRSTPFSPRR